MTIHVTQLFAVNTAAKILKLGLEVGQALGLPVTSWRTGDPTKSLYHYLSDVLAEHDSVIAEFVKAGFLSSAIEAAKASGDDSWLRVLASEMYGVDAPEATYATPTVTLQNAGGGYYPRLVGEITVRCSATGKTYRNTNAPAPLAAGTTVTYQLVADEPGSDSTVNADEIDEVVTTMLGVVVVSSTAGIGSDSPSPDEIGVLCDATLGSLSVNGPPDAYVAVCLNSELTGTVEVKRAYSVGDSTTGLARVYVAGATSGVSPEGVGLCQDACEKWATPQCVTPLVASALSVAVPLSTQITGAGIPADAASAIEREYVKYLASLPIEGTVARSAVLAAIHRAVPQITSAVLLAPAADVDLGVGEIAVSGSITVVEV